jgi:molybdate transport system substrate-binding protein
MKWVVAVLGALLLAFAVAQTWPTRAPSPAAAAPLEVFCAAGLKLPLERLALAHAAAVGQELRLQFGGSGDLLSRLRVTSRGDLFIPADRSFLDAAVAQGLVREIIPLATQRPILAVRAGNPLGITSLDAALARPEVRLGLPNPETASLGALTRRVLGEAGRWEALHGRLAVTKPTVMEVASDVVLGTLDAAIVWDATVSQIPGLQGVEVGALGEREEVVAAGVLTASTQPTAALRFARFAASPEHGNPVFSAHGYAALPGDRWAEQPTALVYSGAINRPAIAGLLQAFAEREGARIDTVYNGCGILCASMQAVQGGGAGELPDAYFACDVCFVPPVAEHFPEAVLLTEAGIVVAVPQGNPGSIASLADLARPGLRLGICNAQQSTLGFITQRILVRLGLEASVMRNVVSQVPTGDLLVNQLRTGSLDAAIVYRTNIHGRDEAFDAIDIDIQGLPARAVQPFAVRSRSPCRQLMQRLLASLQAHPGAFIDAGFVWRVDQQPIRSVDLPIPEHLRGAGARF